MRGNGLFSSKALAGRRAATYPNSRYYKLNKEANFPWLKETVRLGGGLCNKPRALCCVSVNKIFDSVRDKDCLEDLRVYLCDIAQ